MILSESEKNRIKGLYGLVTESEASAPPPDESVLVAKKNPFKDVKFKDFIRGYSPKLKDGELFTIFQPNKDKILSDINSKIYDKTIRLLSDIKTDKIVKIPKFTMISFDDLYDYNYQFNQNSISSLSSGQIHGDKIYVNSRYTPNRYFYNNDYYDLPENLLKLFNDYIWHKLPDEYFEIRKIQREKTDF